MRALARARKASASRVIADLVESGLKAQDAERERFFQLADRLARSKDNAEQEQIKEELARLTFGDFEDPHQLAVRGCARRDEAPDVVSQPGLAGGVRAAILPRQIMLATS